MSYTKTGIVLLFFIITFSFSKNRPIIGILSNITPPNTTTIGNQSEIWGGYVRWLEQAGAEVVAIHPWCSPKELELILQQINGIMFMGIFKSINLTLPFEKTINLIFDNVLKMNKQGDYFPLWSTCFGYETILAHVAGDSNIIKRYESLKKFDKNEITEKGYKSKLFSNFVQKDFDNFNKKNSTYQIHTLSIGKEDFSKNQNLTNFFEVTSYGITNKGETYVNSVESKQFPIYGVQYHPEVIPYARNLNGEGQHTIERMRISQLNGIFFIDEVNKNTHFFNKEKLQNIKCFDYISSYEKGNYEYINNYYNFKRIIL